MKSIVGRLLLAALAIPMLVVLVFWLPQYGFLAFHVVCVAGALIGSLEVKDLLAHRGIGTFGNWAAVLGATFPLLAYLQTIGVADQRWLPFWIVAVPSVLLIRSICMNNDRALEALLGRLSASLFGALYPGLFVYFIARITSLDGPSWKLAVFFAMIFANDTAAYVVGKGFGKSLRLLISPHKSLIGFLAGFGASIGIAALLVSLVPEALPGGLPMALLIGSLVGVSTIFGDLAESGLKRSAAVKDSGTLMMGRGGFLDSIDSMMLSAPLYFALLSFVG